MTRCPTVDAEHIAKALGRTERHVRRLRGRVLPAPDAQRRPARWTLALLSLWLPKSALKRLIQARFVDKGVIALDADQTAALVVQLKAFANIAWGCAKLGAPLPDSLPPELLDAAAVDVELAKLCPACATEASEFFGRRVSLKVLHRIEMGFNGVDERGEPRPVIMLEKHDAPRQHHQRPAASRAG